MKRLGTSVVAALALMAGVYSCSGNPGFAPATHAATTASLISRTPHATATIPPRGMFHVMTGDYLTASNELSNLPLMAQYLTYAYVPDSKTFNGTKYLGRLQKLGVRTIYGTNPLEPICSTLSSTGSCTFGDTYGYNYLKSGGAYNSAASRDCTGKVIVGSYNGLPALQLNVYASNASAYVQAAETAAAKYVASQNPGYANAASVFFVDNVTTWIYGSKTRQCGVSSSTQGQWYAQTAKVLGATTKGPYKINGLVAADVSIVQQELLAINAPTIAIASAEQCYGGHYWNSTYPGNYVADTTKFHTWYANEYAEIHTIALGKIFWCGNRLQGPASALPAWRKYTFASFLLGYAPLHAVYTVQLTTPSTLKVYPEMMFVPTLPTVTATDVSGYLQTSGVYLRKFSACYYRGALQGTCAVAVNPNPSKSVPTPSGYKRHVVLNGSGVLDGGTLAITSGVPTTMAPVTAEILLP